MNSLGESNLSIIISCEHAGNDVPEEYKRLFQGREDVLSTHKGIDIGALELARFLSDKLKAPLFYNTITRLLIEANRSDWNKELFSIYSSSLSEEEKKKLIEQVYQPYRKQVKDAIDAEIAKDKRVLHLSIHSFTPVLHGEVRTADIGLLFDPGRFFEKRSCFRLKEHLTKNAPEFITRFNYPYRGTEDGFTTELRKTVGSALYAGIELEVNQKHFTDNAENVERIKKAMIEAIHYLEKRLKENNL